MVVKRNLSVCYYTRLHTGGYSLMKKENDMIDFQIVHHYIDLNELTLRKQIPVSKPNQTKQ